MDPYKLILYKIIGRCELNKKSLPDVVATTEDYVWLQVRLFEDYIKDYQTYKYPKLSLVRESAGGEESAYEQYRLSDLQSMMVKFGSKRFDPNGSSPWNYFKVLLLTLQFERVCHIAFLYLIYANDVMVLSIHRLLIISTRMKSVAWMLFIVLLLLHIPDFYASLMSH